MFLAGLVGGFLTLLAYLKRGMNRWVKEAAQPLENKMDKIAAELDQTQKDNAKNFITNFLAEVERGKKYSQAEMECFCENLRVYEKKDGDGFVHSEINRLQSCGKLPKF